MGFAQILAYGNPLPYNASLGLCAAAGASLLDVEALRSGGDPAAAAAAVARLASATVAGGPFWVNGTVNGDGGTCTAVYGGWGPQDQAPGSSVTRPCSDALPVLCQRGGHRGPARDTLPVRIAGSSPT